jgi:hypothetical protein
MEQQYAPGDIVQTTYGVGVVTQCPTPASNNESSSENTFYQLLLWRTPGKSVGSSSVAHLQPSAVRQIPFVSMIAIILFCLFFLELNPK